MTSVYSPPYCIVLFKMFSESFFTKKKLILMSTALKLCEVMYDVVTQYFMCPLWNKPRAIIAAHNGFICSLKMQLAACFKHLPESVGSLITP